MSDVLIGLWSDILTANGTLSVTSGAAHANFPVTNMADVARPAKAFKATGTSVTVRDTFASPVSVVAASLINHNLAGATVTLTNNSGLSVPMPIPANRRNGLSINPGVRFSASSATQWNVAVSGASANVAIGSLLLIAELTPVEIRLGALQDVIHKSRTLKSDYDVKVLNQWVGIRQRRYAGPLILGPAPAGQTVAFIEELIDDSCGQVNPFVLIPDSDVNDVLLVDLNSDVQQIRYALSTVQSEIDLEFLEVQRGPAF